MTTPAPLDVDRAEGLASLLQADLTTAGHVVPHSLALELVAHQHGARDWETLHALLTRPSAPTGSRAETPRASTGPLEWETVQQTTTAMTVGELRAAIEHLPAHLPVVVSRPTEPGPDADRILLPASAVEVGPSMLAAGDVVVLRGELMTGVHRRARRLTLTLSGVPHDDENVVERVRTAVDDAVTAATGGPGHQRHTYRYRPDEGVAAWTWMSGSVPLEELAAVARAEIAALDPGGWRVTTEPATTGGPHPPEHPPRAGG